MTEEWRPVVGREGQYEVSNLGRVRSVPRTEVNARGAVRNYKGRIRAPNYDRYGYAYLRDRIGTLFFHTAVAAAFLGPRPDFAAIRHLDGNRKNNRANNLAYGSKSDNCRDCYKYGGRHSGGKLYRDDILDIRAALTRGELQKDIAAKYGVSAHTVSNIKTGRTFSYIK